MLSQPDFKFCHSCDSCCHYLSNKLGLDFVHYRVTDPITDPIDTSQPFSVSEHRGERVAEKQPEGEELFDFVFPGVLPGTQVAESHTLTTAWGTQEKLIRLPDNFLCFIPHPDTPLVGPPPFESNGWVTFGRYPSAKCISLRVHTRAYIVCT
jgi:hypothetical protein